MPHPSDSTAISEQPSPVGSARAASTPDRTGDRVSSTPFHDPDFLSGLCSIFLPEVQPLVVRAGPSTSMVTAIYRSRLGPLPVRMLSSAALHHASITDMQSDPASQEAGPALLDELLRLPCWDVMQFRAVLEGSGLHRAAAAAGAAVVPEPDSHALPLDRQFISNGRARELRRLLRRAGEETGTVARVVRPADREWALAVESLTLLHRDRWHDTDTPSPFEDVAVRTRLIAWMAGPADRWSPVATVLVTGDRITGVALGFDDGVRLHAWRIAYHPDLLPYSPVRQLLTLLAFHGVDLGRNSLELGRGDDEYKRSWNTVTRPRVAIRWHRDTSRTRILRWLGAISGRRWLDGWGSAPTKRSTR